MSKGKVIIIGAGPGDPDLITLKAIKHLNMADVILTDRLVSREIINEHASMYAHVILVGKEGCNSEKSYTQQEINDMMVYHAMQGRKVVRLKGGDVAFFSNVLDELQTLIDNQIDYEIVPGITAASGASAYAGMPLTARNHARGVRFLTFSKSTKEDTVNWQELATTQDTLVFYMAGESWKDLAAHFIQNNVDNGKKIAIIEQATTPYQKVFVYDFDEVENSVINRTFVSPSLVVIGAVVDLHEKFAWKSNASLAGNYFPPATKNAIEKNTLKQTA